MKYKHLTIPEPDPINNEQKDLCDKVRHNHYCGPCAQCILYDDNIHYFNEWKKEEPNQYKELCQLTHTN